MSGTEPAQAARQPSKPIGDYALIGDLHTAALVARDGSIDWLCLPHFDSRACFAALVGDESAGHWSIAPAGTGATSTRQYVDDTLLLETRWDTSDGAVRVTDFMAPRGDVATVVRIVEGVSGRVEMLGTLRLRFDYGRVRPWLQLNDEGRELCAMAGPDAVWLRADVPLHTGQDTGQDTGRHTDQDACHARFSVSAGETVAFVLSYRPSYESAPDRIPAETLRARATAAWHEWIGRCDYDGRWQPEVRRSLLLLKALTYAPTGGIVAAATTSLPECLGGERNWDYRYCWLRDATFTLQALLGTGYTEEAKAWREWLVRAVAGDAASLQIMYGLDGTQRFPESALDHLSGYAGSTPVRIGNAAAGQHQLDVWGETLDGLYLTRKAGLHATESAWDLQLGLLDWLESHWDEPDNGLWEMRGPRRHFVHSKVLAWAGVDRAIDTVERHGLHGPVDTWRRLAQKIRDDVLEHGYDAERNTFTQYYGSQGLDAALLLIPRVHFLPWDDERVVGTVRAVQRELDDHGLLRRYDPGADGGDGLPGTEGAFVACNFWLADALHGIGHKEEAEQLFGRLLDLRNDVGMLSEEYDAASGRQLGNTPQAFSLVGLINSARHLSGTRPSASTDVAGRS